MNVFETEFPELFEKKQESQLRPIITSDGERIQRNDEKRKKLFDNNNEFLFNIFIYSSLDIFLRWVRKEKKI